MLFTRRLFLAAFTGALFTGVRSAGAVAPKLAPKGPNKLLFYKNGQLSLIDPDGSNEQNVTKDLKDFIPDGPSVLSPDGTHIATLLNASEVDQDATRWRLYVRKLDEKELGTKLGVECEAILWSPDGTQLLCQGFPDGPVGKTLLKLPEEYFLIDVRTKKNSPLRFPNDHIITDWSRDGQYFLTTRIDKDAEGPNGRLYLMNRDGTEHKAVTDGKQIAILGALSPDGKRVLHLEVQLKNGIAERVRKLVLAETTTGTAAPVADIPLNGEVLSHCWSPDGKRIAYIWRQVHEGELGDVREKETESHLVVCDPDGKDQKTLVSEKGTGQNTIALAYVSWR